MDDDHEHITPADPEFPTVHKVGGLVVMQAGDFDDLITRLLLAEGHNRP